MYSKWKWSIVVGCKYYFFSLKVLSLYFKNTDIVLIILRWKLLVLYLKWLELYKICELLHFKDVYFQTVVALQYKQVNCYLKSLIIFRNRPLGKISKSSPGRWETERLETFFHGCKRKLIFSRHYATSSKAETYSGIEHHLSN